MKTFIVALLVLHCSASFGQITREHVIPDSNESFTVIQIDSDEYCYKTEFYGDSLQHEGVDIKLFDLNYKLIKEIDVPIKITGDYESIMYITRRLFDLDDSIEYLYYRYRAGTRQLYYMRILKESGTVLFSCDSCSLGGVHNTSNGTKLVIMKHQYIGTPVFPGNEIYSLPGKLPTSTSAASNPSSTVTDDIAYIQSALNIESFPNPASDRIQVNYKLPAGATSGFITIRDTKGAELQRHRINCTEESIALDTQSLSPGSYYCCLLTDDGRTAVKKMMVVR